MTDATMIEVKLKNVLSSVLGVDAMTLQADASPDTVDGWDSLKHLNIIIAIEEEFGVSFGDERVVEMLNYKLILAHLKELLATNVYDDKE